MAPEPPVASAKPGNLLKKIPPWGWAIGAGGVLGLGYTLYRNRREGNALAPPAGEADLAASPYTEDYLLSSQPSPGGYYSSPIIAEPAETVGAVGQVALETAIGGITGIIETVPAILAAAPVPQVPDAPEYDLPGILGALGAFLPQTPAPAPAAIPEPAKPPAAQKPAGVTILGRTFRNALSYTERSNPGIGRTFDVKFPTSVERWETWDTEERKVGATFGKAKPKVERVKIQRKWKKISERKS